MKPMLINAFQYWSESEVLVDSSPKSSFSLVSLLFRADSCGLLRLWTRICFFLLLPVGVCIFLAPKSGFNSLRIAHSWHSFGFSPRGFFPQNFVFIGYLLRFAFPDQSLFWSCCCQHFLIFLLVPKDGPDSAARDRMVVFPDITIADNFFSDTFSFRNAWFQLAF